MVSAMENENPTTPEAPVDPLDRPITARDLYTVLAVFSLFLLAFLTLFAYGIDRGWLF